MKTWTQADEDAFEAKYQAQLAAEEEAFEARGCQPPRQSKVYGPPADWRRWGPLLDGIPVENCFAFDADAGWVEVWVVAAGTPKGRLLNTPRRRLSGKVEVLPDDAWQEARKTGVTLVIDEDHLQGDPLPGTELHRGSNPKDRHPLWDAPPGTDKLIAEDVFR
jgi:hypothetical protein